MSWYLEYDYHDYSGAKPLKQFISLDIINFRAITAAREAAQKIWDENPKDHYERWDGRLIWECPKFQPRRATKK